MVKNQQHLFTCRRFKLQEKAYKHVMGIREPKLEPESNNKILTQ